MTLNQLIKTHTWPSVLAILLECYPEEEESIENYKSVFEKLKLLPAEKTEMAIVLKHITDDYDGLEHVDVSGRYKQPKTEEEKFSQAIEFTPWREWLGMTLGRETLQEFSELEILAHCLYEMTFAGFEEEEIQAGFNSLKKTVDDCKKSFEEEKQQEANSFDELLKNLGIDRGEK